MSTTKTFLAAGLTGAVLLVIAVNADTAPAGGSQLEQPCPAIGLPSLFDPLRH